MYGAGSVADVVRFIRVLVGGVAILADEVALDEFDELQRHKQRYRNEIGENQHPIPQSDQHVVGGLVVHSAVPVDLQIGELVFVALIPEQIIDPTEYADQNLDHKNDDDLDPHYVLNVTLLGARLKEVHHDFRIVPRVAH